MILLISELPPDRSIIQAYPTIFEPKFSRHFAHSMLDLPVVMTSSRIKIFLFLQSKPLLKLNILSTLSTKILGTFKNFDT